MWEKVSYISLAELKHDSFLHLYCQQVEEKYLAEIRKKYPDKLLKEKSIMNLFSNWDQLERNHVDVDILGCLVPYKPVMLLIIKWRVGSIHMLHSHTFDIFLICITNICL